jgi:hypothetical protein
MPRKDGSTLVSTPAEGGDDFDELAEHNKAVEAKLAKQGVVLGSTLEAADKSWAAVGLDTSPTAIAACAVGYDAKLDKRVGPTYGEIRWAPEVEYLTRLGQAAKSHDLVLSLLRELWVVSPERVWIAYEEPIFFGSVRANTGSYIMQQCMVCGAAVGAIVRYGFSNVKPINNSQWHATLRKDGVEFERAGKGATDKEKRGVRWRNKMAVKGWAVQAFGLPELPDLVAVGGAKVPRPESGRGANARAEQPSDVYDAAAVCAWQVDDLEERGIA